MVSRTPRLPKVQVRGGQKNRAIMQSSNFAGNVASRLPYVAAPEIRKLRHGAFCEFLLLPPQHDTRKVPQP